MTPARACAAGNSQPLVSASKFPQMYTSSRFSAGGGPVGGVYLQRVTLTTDRLFRRADASIGVYNAFGRRYGDPGSAEHLQTEIPQEGRTLRATLTVRF